MTRRRRRRPRNEMPDHLAEALAADPAGAVDATAAFASDLTQPSEAWADPTLLVFTVTPRDDSLLEIRFNRALDDSVFYTLQTAFAVEPSVEGEAFALSIQWARADVIRLIYPSGQWPHTFERVIALTTQTLGAHYLEEAPED